MTGARSGECGGSLPLKREVASGIQNMGSTCYMNAVLQVLAHSPDLCYAIDAHSHCVNCPKKKCNDNNNNCSSQKKGDSTGETDKDETTAPTTPSVSKPPSPTGTIITANGVRKSTRTRSSPNLHNMGDYGYGGEVIKAENFCTLCEVERHLSNVHSSTSPVQPRTFVNGFIQHVAPAAFQLGIQEDSHEFLRLLIDAMQKSCRESRSAAVSSSSSANKMATPDDEANAKATASANGDENKENSSNNAPGTSPSQASEQKDAMLTDTADQAEDTEYPFKLFRGTVESKVRCDNCRASSSKIDPIEDVGLEVLRNTAANSASSNGAHGNAGSGSGLSSVQDAFAKYVQSEPLTGYKCDKCHVTGTASKVSRLASLPPILTLHLKRFRYGGAAAAGDKSFAGSLSSSSSGSGGMFGSFASSISGGSFYSSGRRGAMSDPVVAGGVSGSAKIDGHIKFPEVLMLDPYMKSDDDVEDNDGKSKRSKSTGICRLFAVIVHSGKNSHSGHYIAYVKSLQKNEWWKMDDHRVVRSSKQEVLGAEAYMLFYQVVNHPTGRYYKTAAETANKIRLMEFQKMEEARNVQLKQEEEAKQLRKEKPKDRELNDSEEMTSTKSKKRGRDESSSDRMDVIPEEDVQPNASPSPTLISDWNSWAQENTTLDPKHFSVFEKAQDFIRRDASESNLRREFKDACRAYEQPPKRGKRRHHHHHRDDRGRREEPHDNDDDAPPSPPAFDPSKHLRATAYDMALEDCQHLFWKLAKRGTIKLKKLASKAMEAAAAAVVPPTEQATVSASIL